MTIKELKQYRSICKEISEIEIELKDNSKNSVVNGSMSVFPYIQHSIKIDGITDTPKNQVRMIRLRRLQKQKEQIERFVDGIEDSLTRRIFEYRYITGGYKMTWERIAIFIGGGNTGDGVRMIHNRFLMNNGKK